MSTYAPLAVIAGAGLVGVYLYNKFSKTVLVPNKIYYKFDIAKKYDVQRSARQYDYTVAEPTFEQMEEKYKESLYGNPIMKSEIDHTVKDYIKTYPDITQRYIVINRPEWGCRITNNAGSNDDCLVIDIMKEQSNPFRCVELK